MRALLARAADDRGHKAVSNDTKCNDRPEQNKTNKTKAEWQMVGLK